MAVRKYEMSDAQLERLLEACRPVAMIALQCGSPRSPQENANAAWAGLGKEMGFDPMTVRPAGDGDRLFYAEPIDTHLAAEARDSEQIAESANCSGQDLCAEIAQKSGEAK